MTTGVNLTRTALACTKTAAVAAITAMTVAAASSTRLRKGLFVRSI